MKEYRLGLHQIIPFIFSLLELQKFKLLVSLKLFQGLTCIHFLVTEWDSDPSELCLMCNSQEPIPFKS